MTIDRVVERIRQDHQDCCLTSNCRESGCSIGLRGLNGSLMVIIHGTRYQRTHGYPHRLSDRIIFSAEYQGFIGVIELKSGRSPLRLRPTIDQVRGGLRVAEQLLDGLSVYQWHAALAFSGNMRPEAATALRARQSLVQFQGHSSAVTKRDCRTELADVVQPAT